MIGSTAFFAPEIATSPSSGKPPLMRSLSTGAPLRGRERAHRQRVDLLAHALAERGVHQLVALHAAAPLELARHDERREMLTVTAHLEVLAGEPGCNSLPDAFSRHHFLSPHLVAVPEQRERARRHQREAYTDHDQADRGR